MITIFDCGIFKFFNKQHSTINSDGIMNLTKIVFRAFQIIFLAIGIVMTVISIRQYLLALETYDWPFVTGKITEAKIKRYVTTDNPEGDISRQTYEASYIPKIIYNYQVNGQEYTNNKIQYTSHSKDTKQEAKAVLDMFPDKNSVRIYYDPEKPEKSVLLQGGNNNLWIIGVIFIGLGLVFIFIYNFIKPNNRRKSYLNDRS